MIEITIWNYSVATVENTTEDASRRVKNFISSSIYKRTFPSNYKFAFFFLTRILLTLDGRDLARS